MRNPEDSPAAPSWLRRLRLVELGVVLAAALFALQFHARLGGQLPSEDDHRRLGEVLRAERAEGDVVLLFPWWTERARLYVPDRVPVVGYQGSDPDPLTRYRRIWVIGQPDLPRADPGAFEAAFGPGRERLGEVRRFGPLTLTLYRNGRHRPLLLSAADGLPAARVAVESPASRADCTFDGRAHRCPGNLHVAAEWHEVMFEPRRCLWMTPPGGPARLVVELPAPPAGASLVLEAGFIWDRGFFKSSQLTPSRLTVESGAGAPLIDLTLPAGLEGLQRAEARLEQPGPVRLTLQSDNPELRELCVDLFAYGPVEAAIR